ncbi:Nesprin-1 [Halotydeus destructor]|nr:Nesprin-1 [Halotydeus destructor]
MSKFAHSGTKVVHLADGFSYVSERQYLRHIEAVREEQERLQMKVFGKWINSHLPGCIRNDLVDELKDGTKLIDLLELLSGEKLRRETGRHLRRIHFLNNVTSALEHLKKRRVKLVSTHASDIVDGKVSIVLGLIWTIIVEYSRDRSRDTSRDL